MRRYGLRDDDGIGSRIFCWPRRAMWEALPRTIGCLSKPSSTDLERDVPRVTYLSGLDIGKRSTNGSAGGHLISCLADPAEEVRKAALHSLITIGSPAVPDLIRASRESVDDVRLGAILALRGIGGQIGSRDVLSVINLMDRLRTAPPRAGE
jgi:hypothetical protein